MQEKLLDYKKNTYIPSESITFWKTKELFGGLSNMAPGYPIYLNGKKILTSEALYQACKFPNQPNVQSEIIKQHSPITAKQIAQNNSNLIRPDWYEHRIKIMNWC